MPASRPAHSDDVSPTDGDSSGPALASGKSLNPVVGRERELSRLNHMLGEARAGRSSVLLVTGEPGVGKTTLLDALRAAAEGFTCLTVRGTESEQDLAHAGLLGLVNPIRTLVDELPQAQAGALRSALGWSPGPAGADRFLLGAATLSLLAAAGERRPVLVLVDDLQWVDLESAAAIVFAARRLGPDAVTVLLTARTASVPARLVHGLPVLPLEGLSAPAAAVLVPAVASSVLDRLVADTRGNPLALLEVSGRLDELQRSGAAALPEQLPVGERLRGIYVTTLAALSPGGRKAVLLVALAGASRTGSGAVHRVLTSWGVDADGALEEALRQGVLVRDGTRYEFRHPLLRSVVLETVGPAEQRAAHAALADALPQADRAQVWHRSEATLGPDAQLAGQLARLAHLDRERLGHAAASLGLERAADLTPEPDLAAARLAEAAQDAFVAGDVGRVQALAGRVLRESAPDRTRGEALFTLGMLEQYAGSVPRSVEYLADAADLLEGVEQVRALTELALARFRLNDVAGVAECAGRIDAAPRSQDPEQQLLSHFTGGVALMLTGDLETGGARLAEVRRLADLPSLRHDPRALLLMALAAGFTGQVGDAVQVGAARLEEVRRRGAIGVLVPGLAILAAGRAMLGDHAAAYADAGEAVELAAPLGYAADAAVAVEMLAWQAAARGMHDAARDALTQARELTDRAGTTSAAAHQSLTAAFCALCRGDLVGVASTLEQRIAADGGVGAMGEPLGVAPLLVEAYVGLGRHADARALARRYRAVTTDRSSALAGALASRCEAITATEPAAAETAFAAALNLHAADGDPFEAARTRLLYGSWLRRAGRRVDARGQLSGARDRFESMDLTHWATVATEELAATGATARRRSTSGVEALTSQETRVALLAAQGLANKEIGASLFLSPKTVERHLSQVFRKRGFRSRTELAAAFARQPTTPA